MALINFTFNWIAVFCYSNSDYKFPFKSKVKSASFGNENVKFVLSAESSNDTVTFFIKLDPFYSDQQSSILSKIVCITQSCITTFSEENDKLNTKFIKQEKWENVCSSYSGSCHCITRCATIELKIAFFDEQMSSFSNTWSSIESFNTVNQAETLCNQLTNLKLNSNLADVTIVVDETEFKVHSVVLAMRSPVFAAMFSDEGHFKEKKKKKVEIKDIDAHVMEIFIAFLYGQKNIEWKSIAGELATVADKYDVQPLFDACIISLAADVTVEIAAKNFHYAYQLGKTDIMRRIGQFISKNKAAVKATDDWEQYILSNIKFLEALYEATP